MALKYFEMIPHTIFLYSGNGQVAASRPGGRINSARGHQK
jgi:hypothetical protein